MKSLLFTFFITTLLCYNGNGQTTWTAQTVNPTGTYALTSGAGVFVAMGLAGAIYSSPNGTTWTSRTSGTGLDFNAVAFGQSQFVSAAYNTGTGANDIVTSPDGINWTVQPTTGLANGVRIRSIANNGTTFVGVGYNYTSPAFPVIYTSTNGQTWTLQTSGAAAPSGFSCVKYGNGIFVALLSNGNVFTSSNGITWSLSAASIGITVINNDVMDFGNGLFIINGANGALVTSSDGVTWTPRITNTTNLLLHTTWGNNTYVTVGVGGFISTSPDLTTWTVQSSGTTNGLTAVTFSNNTFVASAPDVSLNITTSTSVPLPLGLMDFSGKVTPNGNELYWTTAQSSDIRSFSIEHSTDARLFNTIGSVNAERSASQQYSYTDITTDAVSYYRLIMVDKSGNKNSSPVIVLNNISSKSLKIEHVFGSPFNDCLTIGINTNKEGAIIARLMDMNGKIVFETNFSLQNGYSVQQLPGLKHLSSGQYVLQIVQGGYSDKIKAMKE